MNDDKKFRAFCKKIDFDDKLSRNLYKLVQYQDICSYFSNHIVLCLHLCQETLALGSRKMHRKELDS